MTELPNAPETVQGRTSTSAEAGLPKALAVLPTADGARATTLTEVVVSKSNTKGTSGDERISVGPAHLKFTLYRSR